ncbi:MAG: hypothetical protein SGILL_003849, partial [Bacillariaceae sp.]
NGPIARQDISLKSEDIQRALAEVAPTRLSHQYVTQLQTFLASHRQDVSPGSPPQGSFPPPILGGQTNGMAPSEHGYRWETNVGNFYQFHVPVDPTVFDAIQEIYWHNYNNQEDEDFFSDSDYLDDDSDSDFDL